MKIVLTFAEPDGVLPDDVLAALSTLADHCQEEAEYIDQNRHDVDTDTVVRGLILAELSESLEKAKVLP